MKRICQYGLAVVMTLCTGCAAVGDFFVPKHEKSGKKAPDISCIYVERDPAKAAIAAPLAAAAIGFLVDKAASAIKEEGDRYKASYSATIKIKFFDDNQRINQLTFARWPLDQGKLTKCGTSYNTDEQMQGKNASPLVKLDMKVQKVLDEEWVFEIQPFKLTLHGVKAKVRSPYWYIPWSWWMYLDSDSGKVEMKTRVAVSVVTTEKEHIKPEKKDSDIRPADKKEEAKKDPQNTSEKEIKRPSDLLLVDIPIGKVDLTKIDSEKNLENTAPGWFVLPVTKENDPVPMSITITFEEADDLGDVIKKGAGEAWRKQKQDSRNNT